MNNGRYKNQNVAVLGAGLSGSAAALLLASEGAQVTVLDSADENNLLKSTLDNLRAHGVRVVCGSEADRGLICVRLDGSKSGHRSSFSVGAQFFLARN